MKKHQPIAFTFFNDPEDKTGAHPVRIEISSPEGIDVRVVAEQTLSDGRVRVAGDGTAGAEYEPIRQQDRAFPQPARPRTAFSLAKWRESAFNWGERLGLLVNTEQGWAASASLPLVLFGAAILVYLLVRFINLPGFPIYFTADEAIQTTLAKDFIRDGFQNYTHEFWPAYFQNIDKFSLGLTVYIQLISYLLLGASIWVSRGTSIIVSLLAAFSVSYILRDIFKSKYWWAGALLLSLTPVWFLYSRTALEVVCMVSFYALALCFYLLYRYRRPSFLYLSVLFYAMAFYSYAPAQFIVPLTAVLLALSDIKYHIQNWKTILGALGIGLVLALPYARFRFSHPAELITYLTTLNSYWVENTPVSQKIGEFLAHYLYFLSPLYWFVPAYDSTDYDSILYIMKGYGFLSLASLPFFVWGVVVAIRNFKASSAHRAILLTLVAAPAAASLVLSPSAVSRTLVYVIPAVIISIVGLDSLVEYALKHRPRIGSAVTPVLFSVLILINGYTLVDALGRGPTWFPSYEVDGMQWGAGQLYAAIKDEIKKAPQTQFILTSVWVFNMQVLNDFFLPPGTNLQGGRIEDYAMNKRSITDNTLFIMAPDEFSFAEGSGKFKSIQIVNIVRYPDDKPGFFFVKLQYVDNIDQILADEAAKRQIPIVQEIKFHGQQVKVLYSVLGGGTIENLFDGDPGTFIRTLEANPAIIELTLPTAIQFKEVGIMHGSSPILIKVLVYDTDAGDPTSSFSGTFGPNPSGSDTLKLGQTVTAKKIRFEVTDTSQGVPGLVHIWELTLN